MTAKTISSCGVTPSCADSSRMVSHANASKRTVTPVLAWSPNGDPLTTRSKAAQGSRIAVSLRGLAWLESRSRGVANASGVGVGS